jgi:ferritin-like metal-binding protein YciE
MAKENQDVVQKLFVTGLRDAHAVEHQALALMDRQLERLQNYPEVEARMREHRVETEQQIQRIDHILESIGESHSGFKDAALTMSGNMAALAHTLAGDEILKNSFANFAFENFEAASYKALITVADYGGYAAALPLLRETLEEELAMARFCDEILPQVTRRFITLRESGETASH